MSFARFIPHIWLGLALSGLVSPAARGSSAVVISQIYGGGGNEGATLTHDFVELLNRTGHPVDITGWTVQYASADGSTWDRTVLSGMIQPGQYYLVQERQGNGGSVPLPAPDASGGLALSAIAGKVALVSDSLPLAGSAPQGLSVVDLVGYGDANYAEGEPAGQLNNTTAAIRKDGGCTDTDDNAADFAVSAPIPRNSGSALNLCTPPAPSVPEISEAGVTNAASYQIGAVAPGEIVTIFGTRLGPKELATLQLTPDQRFVTTSLAGTRVLFDGVAAPIIYTLEGQVSAVVPFAVAGTDRTTLLVEYDGQRSNPLTLDVRPSAPGIFTLDSSGRGQGAILNQDYSVNGPARPAAKGSVVIIYATGGGQTEPAGADGRVIGADLPVLAEPVSVRIGGVQAPIHYAGAAPGFVSGVVQVNATVPETLTAGGSLPIELIIGGAASQPGVTVQVSGGAPNVESGENAAVEEKFDELRSNAELPPLPEIPHDAVGIPSGWLALVSWNIQVGGASTEEGAERPPMVQSALSRMFSGTYKILAAQEIPNAASASLLTSLLPGGHSQWTASFFDTTDSMDNGIWHHNRVVLRDAFPLFVTNTVTNGRLVTDPTRAVHPPVVAQYQVEDFDFTLITLHLTYADGDPSEPVRELHNVLDYLDWYFDQDDNDPDVLLCGDFNIPSRLSGQIAGNSAILDAVFEGDERFQTGERRLVATVHEPTSRRSVANGGVPLHNYDHCICSVDTLEEFIQARRVSPETLTSHPDDPEVRLTSDHYPIVAFFRTVGEGVALDNKVRIRP